MPYIAIAAAPAAGSPAARYGDKSSCKPTMPCLSEAWGTRFLIFSVYADTKDENEMKYEFSLIVLLIFNG